MKRRRHRPVPPVVVFVETPRTARKLIERKMSAEQEMWAFDRLPPRLRSALANCATNPGAQVIGNELERISIETRLPRAVVSDIMVAELPAVVARLEMRSR